jgi:gluconokinase
MVVMMGVAGSGKSTVGRAVASALGVPFVEGDFFHDVASVEAMRRGEPLGEAQREPWLDRLHAELLLHRNGGVVLACSALRSTYRNRLRAGLPSLRFVALAVEEPELRRRLEERHGHFAGAALLASQLDTLELDAEEAVVDGEGPVDAVVARVIALLARDSNRR